MWLLYHIVIIIAIKTYTNKNEFEYPMQNCKDLFFLSTIACQLAECLDEDELGVLAADLVVLGDMLANIIARNTLCNKD